MDITLINPPEKLRFGLEFPKHMLMEYTVFHHLVLCIYKRLLKRDLLILQK